MKYSHLKLKKKKGARWANRFGEKSAPIFFLDLGARWVFFPLRRPLTLNGAWKKNLCVLPCRGKGWLTLRHVYRSERTSCRRIMQIQ